MKPTKYNKSGLMKAFNTVGADEASIFAMRFKSTSKTVPSKAIFGKKTMRFKTPLLKWDQSYSKIKDQMYGGSGNLIPNVRGFGKNKPIVKPNAFLPPKLSGYPKRSKQENRLIDRDAFGDADRDGVPNVFDCKPLNKKMQGGKSTAAWRKERKDILVKAEKHFAKTDSTRDDIKERYSSLFLLPSGEIINLGPFSHGDIRRPTGLDVHEFMNKTGSVRMVEKKRLSSRQKNNEDGPNLITKEMNFEISSEIPLTEHQKLKLKTLSHKPLKAGVLKHSYPPQVNYDINRRQDGIRVLAQAYGDITKEKKTPKEELEEGLKTMNDRIEQHQSGVEVLPLYDKEPETPMEISDDDAGEFSAEDYKDEQEDENEKD